MIDMIPAKMPVDGYKIHIISQWRALRSEVPKCVQSIQKIPSADILPVPSQAGTVNKSENDFN